MLFGAHHVYALNFPSGSPTWTLQTSQDLTGGCTPGVGSCALQDIAFDPYDANVAWAVSAANGAGAYRVSCTEYANYNSGAAWVNVTGNLTSQTASQFPASLAVSPFKDPSSGHAVVYVTMFAPAGSTTPTGTIFETTSGCVSTATWTALAAPSYNGEPLSVLRLLVDNTDVTGNTLFAGTDIGVFRSTDGGNTWTDYGMGIVPRVPVTDIQQSAAGTIAIATHGAGAYLLPPSHVVFAGYANLHEFEPGVTCNSYTATFTANPPSGAVNGDVFVTPIIVAAETPGDTPTLPPGWTFLPMSNQGGSLGMISQQSDKCEFYEKSWIAVHTYSPNDTIPYQFTASVTPVALTGLCKDAYGACFEGEAGGYIASYRAADQDANDYTAYGYPNPDTASSTTNPVDVAGPDELVNIFPGLAESDDDGGTLCEAFADPTVPSGQPALTIETPLAPACDEPPFLDADIWIQAPGGSFGGYSETPHSTGGGSLGFGNDNMLPAFQVVLPPQQ